MEYFTKVNLFKILGLNDRLLYYSVFFLLWYLRRIKYAESMIYEEVDLKNSLLQSTPFFSQLTVACRRISCLKKHPWASLVLLQSCRVTQKLEAGYCSSCSCSSGSHSWKQWNMLQFLKAKNTISCFSYSKEEGKREVSLQGNLYVGQVYL